MKIPRRKFNNSPATLGDIFFRKYQDQPTYSGFNCIDDLVAATIPVLFFLFFFFLIFAVSSRRFEILTSNGALKHTRRANRTELDRLEFLRCF